MKIDVVATAQQVTDEIIEGKTVVVIDVLRATSVMIAALNKGASQIIPVLEPEEAFDIKEQLGENVILGGERNADLIGGFDFGNSPLDYTNDKVMGKTLVITTTNGTLAIKNCLRARELIVAGFVNDKAISDYLKTKDDVVLVCSGNNGVYTLEDALCAGRIIHLLLKQKGDIVLSDFSLSIVSLYNSNKNNLQHFASGGYHYNILKEKGYVNDLDFCFSSNIYDTIPMWNGMAISKYNRH